MFLAKVVGTVVATRKHQAFQGSKLLLLQQLVAQQRTLVPSGTSVVAIAPGVEGTSGAGRTVTGSLTSGMSWR